MKGFSSVLLKAIGAVPQTQCFFSFTTFVCESTDQTAWQISTIER